MCTEYRNIMSCKRQIETEIETDRKTLDETQKDTQRGGGGDRDRG